MLNKKFLLGTVLAGAVWLAACEKGETEVMGTVSETVTTAGETTTFTTTETTTAAEETYGAEIIVIDYDTDNPETGFVYFIQPVIEQYDEYDKWNLADWECSDTEVMRRYHYGDEWRYRKELIFVFSNYTDEPVTIDSIQIVREADGALVSFTDGSNALDIDFTVQPLHRTDYILKAEDFDYSACVSGIYNAVVNVGLEGYGREFFIDNSGLYAETVYAGFDESTGTAPDFLNEEQRHVFAKAHVMMWKWFWCDRYMPEEYTDTHTADDFMAELYEAFTEDYARELAADYIDENGGLINIDGSRGSDISYYGHCFLPVSADDEQMTFKAVVTHAHSDNPYEVWFEEMDYRMVNTENGWRVDKFSIWN